MEVENQSYFRSVFLSALILVALSSSATNLVKSITKIKKSKIVFTKNFSKNYNLSLSKALFLNRLAQATDALKKTKTAAKNAELSTELTQKKPVELELAKPKKIWVSKRLEDVKFQNEPFVFHTDLPENDQKLKKELQESLKYHDDLQQIAQKYKIPASIVWGFASRESGWGLGLSPQGHDGVGQCSYNKGLFQVDVRWHKQHIENEEWKDATKHIDYAIKLLSNAKKELERYIPHLSEEEYLRMTAAAINCGSLAILKALREGRDIDYFTTGKNYSQDVLNRAGWYQRAMAMR